MLRTITLIFALVATQASAQSTVFGLRKSQFGDPRQRFAFVDLPAELRQGQNYICSFPYKRSQGWIPEELAIVVQTDRRALVSDGILATFDKTPSRAFGRDQADRLILRWDVQHAQDDRSRRTRLDYQLRLDKATGEARLYARPRGFFRTFNRGGRCARR